MKLIATVLVLASCKPADRTSAARTTTPPHHMDARNHTPTNEVEPLLQPQPAHIEPAPLVPVSRIDNVAVDPSTPLGWWCTSTKPSMQIEGGNVGSCYRSQTDCDAFKNAVRQEAGFETSEACKRSNAAACFDVANRLHETTSTSCHVDFSSCESFRNRLLAKSADWKILTICHRIE